MAAAAWTGCTKPFVTQKIIGPGETRGLCFLQAFLKGYSKKCTFLRGNSGPNVVDKCIFVVVRRYSFGARKFSSDLKFSCGKLGLRNEKQILPLCGRMTTKKQMQGFFAEVLEAV
jgi:hypothetical protein